MLTVFLKKNSCYHRKQKMKSFGNHEEFLARIAKSLYYVELPFINRTSLPVTENHELILDLNAKINSIYIFASLLTRQYFHQKLASEIFSEVNKFSLNRLDIEKAAYLSLNGCVSPCLLVLALLYLERLKLSNPKYLSQVSPTELFFISLMVGSKFLQDDGEGEELSNLEWADLTGLSVHEINKAEKQFLDAINWEVFVSKEEFWSRFNLLETKVGLRQGSRRGWFTYTELNLLLQLIDLTAVVQCLWNVMTACLLSYTASVLALVGSTLLVGQIPGLGLKSEVKSTEVANNDWLQAAPLSAFLPNSSQIQDCNVLSSLEFTQETNATESEFLNFCGTSLGSEKEALSLSHSFNLNFLYGLYLHLPPENFLRVGNLMVGNSKEKSPLFLLNGFNVWTWSDYIKNYLVKISVPGNFHSMASF